MRINFFVPQNIGWKCPPVKLNTCIKYRRKKNTKAFYVFHLFWLWNLCRFWSFFHGSYGIIFFPSTDTKRRLTLFFLSQHFVWLAVSFFFFSVGGVHTTEASNFVFLCFFFFFSGFVVHRKSGDEKSVTPPEDWWSWTQHEVFFTLRRDGVERVSARRKIKIARSGVVCVCHCVCVRLRERVCVCDTSHTHIEVMCVGVLTHLVKVLLEFPCRCSYVRILLLTLLFNHEIQVICNLNLSWRLLHVCAQKL